MFGEVSLISNARRSATIITREATDFITISRDVYLRTVRRLKKLSAQDSVADFLSQIPMFAGWTRISLLRLAYLVEERNFRRTSYSISLHSNRC